MKINKSQFAELAKAVNHRNWELNPEIYFGDALTILPKTGDNQSFRPNTHQQKVQRVIANQRKRNEPVRIIILKPRQTGISTISVANLFHGVRFGKGVGMVVSKDGDSTEHIFSIIQRYYNYLPATEKKVLKTVSSNRKELKFEEPHGGRIVTDTAGSKTGAGHSFTIRHLVLSEVSRWPEGSEETRKGLLNAVNNSPGTMIIIESVANGMSGWFYQKWHSQDSDYEKIFLPWFEHNEYQMKLPIAREKYNQTLDPDEVQLMSDYNLSLEQVEWRRWCLRNNCDGNLETFKEQYPSNPREAFLASGNSFFHVPTLDLIKTTEPLRCNLEIIEKVGRRKELGPVPHDKGYLRVWNRPQPTKKYIIGCDVAEGIEIEDAPQDDRHDNSSADILDRDTGEQVCHFHGKITPDEFGRYLFDIGKWYNWAYIGVEANAGYGNHVIDTLLQLGYPSDKLHRRQITDETSRRTTNKWGWYTTKANRRSMMTALDTAIRSREVLLNSAESIRELMAFVTKPDGKIEASGGHKDDRVFSLAIAHQMLGSAPAMALHQQQRPLEPLKPTFNRYPPPRQSYKYRRSIYQ